MPARHHREPGHERSRAGGEEVAQGGRLGAQDEDERDRPGRADVSRPHDLERARPVVARREPVARVGQPVEVQPARGEGEAGDHEDADQQRRGRGPAQGRPADGCPEGKGQGRERGQQHGPAGGGRGDRPRWPRRDRRQGADREAPRVDHAESCGP